MSNAESNVATAAATAAAIDRSLLSAKQILRNTTPEMSKHRKDLICKLLDDIYQLGFTAGVEYLGKEVLSASRISSSSFSQQKE